MSNFEHLHDIHKDEICLVIGNGPSLANVPNTFLSKYISFGSNRIHLKFTPTYYVCIDDKYLKRSQKDIDNLNCIKFLDSNSKSPNSYKINQTGKHFEFSYAPAKELWGGFTVTYAILQIAYYMGFEIILLVGVENNYQIKTKFGDVLTLENNPDIDHFTPDYHRNASFNSPNPDLAIESYNLAKEAYALDNRTIINLTENTSLTMFLKDKVSNWS